MKTIQNIRGYIGERTLRRKSRLIKRNKRIHNFSSAKSVGIIFHCRTEEDFQLVKDFKKYLKENQIQASVLGFINDKQIPDHFLLRTGFNFSVIKIWAGLINPRVSSFRILLTNPLIFCLISAWNIYSRYIILFPWPGPNIRLAGCRNRKIMILWSILQKTRKQAFLLSRSRYTWIWSSIEVTDNMPEMVSLSLFTSIISESLNFAMFF